MMQTNAVRAGAGRKVGLYVETVAVGAPKCRLCECKLGSGDDAQAMVCGECRGRPEAKRLGPVPAAGPVPKGARDFTPADRSLIRAVGGYMPVNKLLATLNARLAVDLGPDAAGYTLEQLGTELATLGIASAQAANEKGRASSGPGPDWAALRRLLAQARASGVLDQITEQTIDDFAIVFSLNAAQVLQIKDVILKSQEEETSNG